MRETAKMLHSTNLSLIPDPNSNSSRYPINLSGARTGILLEIETRFPWEWWLLLSSMDDVRSKLHTSASSAHNQWLNNSPPEILVHRRLLLPLSAVTTLELFCTLKRRTHLDIKQLYTNEANCMSRALHFRKLSLSDSNCRIFARN